VNAGIVEAPGIGRIAREDTVAVEASERSFIRRLAAVKAAEEEREHEPGAAEDESDASRRAQVETHASERTPRSLPSRRRSRSPE
jgi:hypothetical protein